MVSQTLVAVHLKPSSLKLLINGRPTDSAASQVGALRYFSSFHCTKYWSSVTPFSGSRSRSVERNYDGCHDGSWTSKTSWLSLWIRRAERIPTASQTVFVRWALMAWFISVSVAESGSSRFFRTLLASIFVQNCTNLVSWRHKYVTKVRPIENSISISPNGLHKGNRLNLVNAVLSRTLEHHPTLSVRSNKSSKLGWLVPSYIQVSVSIFYVVASCTWVQIVLETYL